MSYNFNHYEDLGLQDKIEAFDKLCETYGFKYDDKNWRRLYIMLAGKDTKLAEGILDYQQSEYARVQANTVATA